MSFVKLSYHLAWNHPIMTTDRGSRIPLISDTITSVTNATALTLHSSKKKKKKKQFIPVVGSETLVDITVEEVVEFSEKGGMKENKINKTKRQKFKLFA